MEQLDRLAHHALRGEVWDKALAYSRQAAGKAIGRSAHREAWSHLEQAITMLPHLPQTKATLEQAVDLRLAMRTSLAPLAECTRWIELGLEAEPLAKALNDPRREAVVHCSVSLPLGFVGRSSEAVKHGERGMAIAESLQEPMLRIDARHSLGLAHWHLGAYRTAIGFFQRDVGLEPEQLAARMLEPLGAGVFEQTTTRITYCQSQTFTALSFAELGEFDQAMRHAERGVKLAQTLDVLFLRALAEAALGAVHLRKGDLQQALHLAQRWLQTYAVADLPMARLFMVANLGEVFNVLDHIEEALALFEDAWQFAESKRIGPRVLALRGDAYGRAGRIDEAVSSGQRALDVARQFGRRGDEARTLFLLGNIHGYGESASVNQARAAYQEALARAHELEMRPLEAQCHLALGELAAKTGNKQQAQERLTLALTMFREMGMQTWPEQAESALKAL
jgi:tetratricopeptide (TPR) repeat protein